MGGLLYRILRGWEPEKWIQFAWATGAMVTTLLTDYAQPADEAQVWVSGKAMPGCRSGSYRLENGQEKRSAREIKECGKLSKTKLNGRQGLRRGRHS